MMFPMLFFITFSILTISIQEIPGELNVSMNVLKRIFPHAKKDDVKQLLDDINTNKNLTGRLELIEDFVETKFGEKRTLTSSPYDDKEYALQKAWQLVQQREACKKFLDFAETDLFGLASATMIKEFKELFWLIDKRNDHLFPAVIISWTESIVISVKNWVLESDPEVIDQMIREKDIETYFRLQYWQLYDVLFETNVKHME